jgi:hypothetical protein
MRLRFTGIETGLASLDHHLAAFHAVDAARADEIADLRRRSERVQRRPELADAVEAWSAGPGTVSATTSHGIKAAKGSGRELRFGTKGQTGVRGKPGYAPDLPSGYNPARLHFQRTWTRFDATDLHRYAMLQRRVLYPGYH